MKKVLGLLTALLIVSSPVSGNEPGTCGHLHKYWTEYKQGHNDRSYTNGHYAGYISGWVDSDEHINTVGVSFRNFFYVVGKWLDNHPEKWHEHRSHCVFWALSEAYGLKD